jgi:hypothetical protein
MSLTRKNLMHKVKTAVTTAGALAMMALQLNYTNNWVQQTLNPSSMQTAFRESTKVPINGWRQEIDRVNISTVADIVRYEQYTGIMDLKKIVVTPDSFVRMHPIMLFSHSTFSHTGFANPLTNTVEINAKMERATVRHELKHIKTYATIRKHPEFLNRYTALAKDRSGQSQYRNIAEAVARWTLLADLLPPEEEHSCQSKGFITCYASQNALEDIAELATIVEEESMIKVTYGNKKSVDQLLDENSAIRKKIELLQEYQIIPREFFASRDLEKLYREALLVTRYYISYNYEKAQIYLDASKKFLKTYPTSAYISNIHATRADIYNRIGHRLDGSSETAILPKINQDAMKEWKQAAPYQNTSTQYAVLGAMEEAYFRAGLDNQRKACRDAKESLQFDHIKPIDIQKFLKERGVL